MLVVLLLAWVVGIPVAVIGAATTCTWYRERRLASTRGFGPARVYRFVRPTPERPRSAAAAVSPSSARTLKDRRSTPG